MRRHIKEIILHCSATPEGRDVKAKDIRQWHKKLGWSDIGYHYIIDLDGTIEKGRDESIAGAHCVGHNKNSIGICYIGGCDKAMYAKDTRTPEQKESMYRLVYEMMEKYGLTIDAVYTHNLFAPKACPSFKLSDFKKEFQEWINEQKKTN